MTTTILRDGDLVVGEQYLHKDNKNPSAEPYVLSLITGKWVVLLRGDEPHTMSRDAFKKSFVYIPPRTPISNLNVGYTFKWVDKDHHGDACCMKIQLCGEERSFYVVLEGRHKGLCFQYLGTDLTYGVNEVRVFV